MTDRRRFGGTDPDSRVRARRIDRGFLATAAAALTMVFAVLLHTVWAPAPRGGTAEARQEETAAQPQRPAAPEQRPAASEREKECADGSDPAASLKPATATGEAVRRIDERGFLKVGVDQNSYNWSHRDPQSGELVGFDIDLVKAIAEDLLGPSARIVYKAISTDQRAEALAGNDVDLVVRTMTILCEHLDNDVAFSTAYFEAGQQLLVPHRSRITGLNSSARGKRLCTAGSSTGEKELSDDAHGVKMIRVPNQLDCLVLLQLGRADGVVTDNALAAGQAAQDPSVGLVGEPLTSELYGVAMSRKDEDLVRRVNHVLEEFREGGESSQWQKSYRKWLDEVLDGESATPPKPLYRD
ncbi:transporter substrate-binding domain-containing protein [Streptomyces sp. XM4193]|uniref:glutamate ABC transporter substrate-binding protein n=1 Tax=Streptomyces sp. XM4193 TaxID=2929782 RepID=UPI001FFBA207|nr:glutamate ABC transporter substrate-binding protein [Streptomyces sp. XM4193]MCK1795813.1 transporter substrate-binding domain-containing protein [Streptomyces sp. XM4193]